MANIYVRSTDGVNTDNGSTWALAKLDMNGGQSIDAAGDTIWVSQAHAESTGSGTVTWDFAGTAASPVRVLCGNDAAEPPTSLATTATETFTSAATLVVRGYIYAYGHTISVGSTTTGVSMTLAQSVYAKQIYEQCSFQIGGTGSSNIIIASSAGGTVIWKSCTVRFNEGTQQAITFTAGAAEFYWQGGSAISGTATPGTKALFCPAIDSKILVEDVDLSNFSSSLKLVRTSTYGAATRFVIRNCKLPASFANFIDTAFTAPGRAEMYNCDSGATNYKIWIEDYLGKINAETTLVRTSGASDGTTGLSWKMVSNANASYPLMPLASPEIAAWNDTTGSSVTATVEVLRDSATNLTDAEIWLEVEYLGSSGSPVGTHISDAKSDVLATAADQTASSVTWTTTGMTNPNKQKLSVTFTPQLKGFVLARVMLAKASTTVYVDPMLTIA